MNIVRLNMSHGTHESHAAIIRLVEEYNQLGRGTLSIMLDTKGAEVRSGDVHRRLELNPGDPLTFTIAEGADGTEGEPIYHMFIKSCDYLLLLLLSTVEQQASRRYRSSFNRTIIQYYIQFFGTPFFFSITSVRRFCLKREETRMFMSSIVDTTSGLCTA